MAVLIERSDLIPIGISITTEPKNPCPPCPICEGPRSVLIKTLETYAERDSRNKVGYHLIAEAPHYRCANPDCCGLTTVDSDALKEYYQGAIIELKKVGHRGLIGSFKGSLVSARWAEKTWARTNT